MTAIKHIVSKGCDTVGDRNTRQGGAIQECLQLNADDIGANNNVGQTGAVIESIRPDCGDWQTICRVGNNHRATGTGVFEDGDGAIIGRDLKLSQHGSWQHQDQRRTYQAYLNQVGL